MLTVNRWVGVMAALNQRQDVDSTMSGADSTLSVTGE